MDWITGGIVLVALGYLGVWIYVEWKVRRRSKRVDLMPPDSWY